MRSLTTRAGRIGAGVLVSGGLAGCAVHAATSPDVAAEHARVAGDVMNATHGPLPARAAALKVTGHRDDTTIDALAVTGTTWHGTITLRVSVDRVDRGVVVTTRAGAGHADDDVVECFTYRYEFPRTQRSGRPKPTACPHVDPLELDRPPIPVDVTGSTRQAARRAIAALASDRRRDVDAVGRAVRRALGPDFTVEASRDDGGVGGLVRYGDSCLRFGVGDPTDTVSAPEHGNDCFGG